MSEFENAVKSLIKEQVELWIEEEGKDLVANEVANCVPSDRDRQVELESAVEEAIGNKDFAETSDLEGYNRDLDLLEARVAELEEKLGRYEKLLNFLGSVINLPEVK